MHIWLSNVETHRQNECNLTTESAAVVVATATVTMLCQLDLVVRLSKITPLSCEDGQQKLRGKNAFCFWPNVDYYLT